MLVGAQPRAPSLVLQVHAEQSAPRPGETACAQPGVLGRDTVGAQNGGPMRMGCAQAVLGQQPANPGPPSPHMHAARSHGVHAAPVPRAAGPSGGQVV